MYIDKNEKYKSDSFLYFGILMKAINMKEQ